METREEIVCTNNNDDRRVDLADSKPTLRGFAFHGWVRKCHSCAHFLMVPNDPPSKYQRLVTTLHENDMMVVGALCIDYNITLSII